MIPATGTTLRRDLTQAAVEFAAEDARRYGFIADTVAPIFPVEQKASNYPVITREAFLKEDDDSRAAGGAYNRIEGGFGDGSYACAEQGLEIPLDDSEVSKYATFFNMEEQETRLLVHRTLLNRERRLATLVMNATTYTATTTGAAWSAVGTGIIAAINTAVRDIQSKTGLPRQMMSLIINSQNFWYLNQNTAIKALWSSTYSANEGRQPVMLPTAQIAEILQIGQVLVGGGWKDTAGEGIDQSLAEVWGNTYAAIAVLGSAGAGLKEPAAFRTMLWTQDSPVLPTMERYRDETVRSEILRARATLDEVATAEADLLMYLLDTTS